ncbi:MAG: hypothetical protein CVV25_06150 [Ignavibacteriae bacterium HGW-Ignavibacteriae-4]|jgi:tellurite resistance protein TerC|nr:MAG: hypothetical protein CVV25_06150 [Ignavibacteriae bacterium HGW-Ignavibacteriae-4]
MDHLFNHPGILAGFVIIIFFMLLLDLGVFNKKAHEVRNKEALIWSLVWISLSMIFSGVIYYLLDHPQGTTDNFSRFQAAYWIEKALSVDNLFVFILVFKFFQIPKKYQHKVLFWGVIGALVFRAIFIFAGVELIKLTYVNAPFLGLDSQGDIRQINLVLTIFGFFLILAGIKSWGSHDMEEEKDMSNNFAVKLVHKFYKVSDHFDGDKFFTVQNGIKMVTPLFVAITVIELTDLIFAVDSIPAIFAIAPDDPFILYTSNIFAILGLRSLYFLLANSMDMFSKLNYGLAVILSFIGVKMLIMPFYHFHSTISLAIIGSVLIISILASIISNKKNN